MADNKFKNKYYQGPLAGGQGPVAGLDQVNESETKGVFGGEGGGKNLKTVGGQGGFIQDGKEEPGFDLHSKSYAGPENWQPENKGVTNPFDVNKG